MSLSCILYILSVAAWLLILWPNPVTIFMAAAFSCLTIPLYRSLKYKAFIWRKKRQKFLHKNSTGKLFLKLSKVLPVSCYVLFIISCIILPLAFLITLVSPQAVAGYAKFRELWAANLRLPPHIIEYWQKFKTSMAEIPMLEKALNDIMANMEATITDLIGNLVSKSFGFVGSTMNLLWVSFLFLTLTILFTVYCRVIRQVACRILHVPVRLLRHFIIAVYKALKAIILGIALVALIQGALCGAGFVFAGISQPAFWGLLATIVAPIPMVGTALVWFPLCISLWFTGKTMAAIGLAIWGAFFISGIDNVLRPFFLKQGIKASFPVLILAILCGLSTFGAVGLILGPVLLAIAMQAYEEANSYYRKKV